jgi:cytochrome c peroxidase
MIKWLGVAALTVFVATASASAGAHQFLPPGLAARIPPRAADAPLKLRNPDQIALGRALFERGTFGGNGRTCATCHPRSNNFTLDAAFISKLPRRDPLFVAERVPALRGLENNRALREQALILENLDGFDKPGTLRSVMHTFALGLTIAPEAGFPLVHGLGWSGDGSPGTGSLREFAVGAVVQHFPRSLARVEGRDFRMPTAVELDALEAFQLSLGRRETPVVDPGIPGFIAFRDANVTAGQTLFAGMPSRRGTRRCSGCHTGGGALNDVDENEQRATGLDRHPGALACTDATAPGDGGFGLEPIVTVDRSTFCTNGATGPVTFRGNLFFNTQTVIEAADTAPFFHDNSAATLEAVVDHYRSDAFNNSVTGAGNGFLISDAQRDQIAAFMRALNVLENIRSATDALDNLRVRQGALADARGDVADAIRVLNSGNVRIYQTTALPTLIRASRLISPGTAPAASTELQRARAMIVQ